MTKVLIVRPSQTKKVDGIGTFCNNLFELMQGVADIEMLPIENFLGSRKPFIRYTYEWNKFFDQLSELDFDVIHINGYATYSVYQAFKAAVKLQKRIVYTGHFHPFSTTKHPIGLKLFNNIFLKPYYKYCDAITTLNDEDSGFYMQYSNKVVRIPHWSKFWVSEEELSKIKKKSKMILFVGRFDSYNKGIDHLFHLPEGKYDIHCVGRGELANKRSDITLHTEISDEELRNLYAEASLLVVPSSYEAFSYAALEALSMNTPIVISNDVRIGDYLHEFSCCTYFNYNDFDAFIKAVDKTKGLLVPREEILKIFNPDVIKAQYASIYRGDFY